MIRSCFGQGRASFNKVNIINATIQPLLSVGITFVSIVPWELNSSGKEMNQIARISPQLKIFNRAGSKT